MKTKIYAKANKYYRRITESLPQGFVKPISKAHKEVKVAVTDKHVHDHFSKFLMLFLIGTFFLLDLYIAFAYSNYRTLKQERMKLTDNFEYWQNVSSAHPNFPDAYYNAGIYALQLGDRGKAVELLDRAIELDPTFIKAIALEKKILR